MKISFRPGRAALAILVAVACGSALADPTPIFGVDLGANFTVNPTAQPAIQQANFQALLSATSVVTETFQEQTPVDPSTTSPLPSPLSLFNGAATLSMGTAGGHVEDREQQRGSFSGRFNTSSDCTPAADGSGCNWWESSADFTLNFASAISAFGFFGTDFGDWLGSLQLDLYSNGQLVHSLTVPSAATQAQSGQTTNASAPNGNLLFYGFTDSAQSYDKIVFHVGQSGNSTDVLGFDDFMIGNLMDVGGTVPEPTSLALVGLSLAGLAAASRRKTQR